MTDHLREFPKGLRLLSSADYSQVFSDATAVSDQSFTVLCRLNGRGYPRLGLAISKKILRKATDRNLVKRIVRESFRLRQKQLLGRDFVVLARRGLRVQQRKNIWRSLEQLWQDSIERCPKKVNVPPESDSESQIHHPADQ